MKSDVALITHPLHLCAGIFIEAGNRFPDRIAHQVANVKFFERIGVDIFYYHFFAFKTFVCPFFFSLITFALPRRKILLKGKNQ